MSVWKQNPDLMHRLNAAQNALHRPVDITTFAGFCTSREELERHVSYYEDIVLNQKPIRRGKAS